MFNSIPLHRKGAAFQNISIIYIFVFLVVPSDIETYNKCVQAIELTCDGNARNYILTFASALYQSCGSPFTLPDLTNYE